MADKILAEFKTDLDKFRKDLDEVKSKVVGLGNDATKSGKQTTKSFQESESASAKLKEGIKGIGAAMVAAFTVQAVIQFGKAVFNITAEFQKFRAVLTNTLGSQSEADAALKRITKFASETPFSVQELTASFVKLANQGFKPTNDEMRKLGDLASSTGKGFDQLTEAIIDAQTGEFERLKEFGIRAEKAGDKVKFTFKGVQTQTDFTADSIRKYVLSLGDMQGVSGASEAISKTLGGQLSNLGDSFDQLLLIIGKDSEGGFAGAMGVANTTLQEFGKALEDKPSKLDGLKEGILSVIEPFQALFESVVAIFSPLNNTVEKGTAFEKILQAWGYLLKIVSLPMKVIIQSFVVMADSVGVATKGLGNIVNFFKGKPFEETGIEKLKNDFLQMGKIVTLQDGAFEHSKETIDKETEAKDKNSEVTKKAITLTKEQEKAIKDQIKEREKLLKSLRESDKVTDENTGLDAEIKTATERQKAINEAKAKVDQDQTKADLDWLVKSSKEESDVILKQEEKEREEKKKTAEYEKQLNKEVAQAALQVAHELTNAIFEMQQRERDAEYNGKLNSLEKQRDAELNFKGATEQDKARINAEYDAKRKKILTEQFEANKRAAIIEANIQGAIAVIEALPNYVLAAAVGVTTAIQLGLIASQPTPEFHKGGVDINPRKKNRKGEFDAKLMKGESVIIPEATSKWKQELEAMNKMKYDDLIMAKYVLPALRKQKEEIAKHQGMTLGNNIAQSIALNGGKFNDGNIVQWLGVVNKTSKENARLISKSLGNKRQYARSV